MRGNGKHREYPISMTADGEPFAYGRVYYFFDVDTEELRNTNGLRRIDIENLGSMGYRVIAISKLRLAKDGAIGDGQKFFLAEIERMRKQVRAFEGQKAPRNRSLKAYMLTTDVDIC